MEKGLLQYFVEYLIFWVGVIIGLIFLEVSFFNPRKWRRIFREEVNPSLLGLRSREASGKTLTSQVQGQR